MSMQQTTQRSALGSGRPATRLVWMVRAAALAAIVAAGGCSRTPPPTPEQMSAVLAPPVAVEPEALYRLQLGDEIDVKFPFQPSMDHHAVVRPDGKISTPGVGDLSAAGLTAEELAKVIVGQTKNRLRDPEVTVIVTRIGEQRVYVAGEVQKPNFVALRPGMTPMQAIALCGGFNSQAKLDGVLVFQPAGGGKYQAIRVNLRQVVEEGVPERVRLAANSLVVVPKTWIAEADQVIDQWVRGLIPALPRVGVGYSLSQ